MAIHTSIVITPENHAAQKGMTAAYSSLLLLFLAAAAVHGYSKRQMRRAKNKMLWQLMKVQLKSKFSFKAKREKSLLFKVFLIAILMGVAFGILFSFTAGLFAFVLSLFAAVVILFIKADRG